MKKKFLLLAVVSISLCGCVNDAELLLQDNANSNRALSCQLSQDEALRISNNFRAKRTTRASVLDVENINVVTNLPTRSSNFESVDTVAYIINYADNSGFTIVSGDARCSGILAYADNGKFSLDNTIATETFVNRIGDYIQASVTQGNTTLIDDNLASCAVVTPIVKGFIDQVYPFNKYVIQYVVPEHPELTNPLAGCVAVAGVTAMLHGANSIKYHNATYNLKNIREAFVSDNTSTKNSPQRRIVGGNMEPPYSYNQALDSIAKLLYWFGTDIGITYGDDGSSGYPTDARKKLNSLGYTVTPYVNYNNKKVAQYLIDKYIINAFGSRHSWIIDGCQYCIIDDDLANIAMHCDWGWGGYGNGFFLGDVFTVDGVNFKPTQYYAVKITDKSLK